MYDVSMNERGGGRVSSKLSRKTFRLRMDEMIRKLREDILSGHYSVGDYLPSELDLSSQFCLSNNSVRRGLDVLVDEGLLEKIPRVGNRIKEPSQEAQTVIRFGCYPTMNSQTELTYLLSEFHRKHPHIRVKTVTISNSPDSMSNFLENDLIDVFTINQHLYQDLVESDKIDLLEPVQSNDELYPFLLKAFLNQGELYAVPFVFSPVIICYNRKHFNEQGIPEPDSSWTWDDLIAYSSQLAVENERYGFYFHLVNPNRWIVFMIQSGVSFKTDESGRYRIHDIRLLDGIEKVRDILQTPQVYPMMYAGSPTESLQLFMDEQVSITMTTYLAMNQLKEAEFDYDVAPLPHLNNYNTLLVIIGLALNSRSKEKAAAKQLIDFLVSHDAQFTIRNKTFSLPAHKSAAQERTQDEGERPSRFQMYKEIIPSFSHFTDLNLSLQQLDVVLRESMLYWAGLKSKNKLASTLEHALHHHSEPGRRS